MSRQEISHEGQKSIAPNEIGASLQKIVAEFNTTLQMINAELQLIHAAQQKLAETAAPRISEREMRPRVDRLLAALELVTGRGNPELGPRAEVGPSHTHHNGPVQGTMRTQ